MWNPAKSVSDATVGDDGFNIGGWHPTDSFKNDIQGGGKGIKDAFAANGGSISNAWKTSVNDQVNHLGDRLSAGWKDLQNWLQGGNKGPIGSAGQVSAPQIPGGGFGGGMGGGQGGFTPLTAPTIGGATGQTMGMMPNNAFRDYQANLANQLAVTASGQGPSIAEQQLRMGNEQNIAAMMAQANSARGGANPAVARAALQQGAEARGALGQQAAVARLQEAQQAQQLLGQVAGQGRQGDIEMAGQDMQKQIEQAKMQVATQGQNADLQKAFAQIQAQYAQMGLDAQKANQMAALEMQKLIQQTNLGYAGIASGANQAMLGGILGMFGSGLGALAATSSRGGSTNNYYSGGGSSYADNYSQSDYAGPDYSGGNGEMVA